MGSTRNLIATLRPAGLPVIEASWQGGAGPAGSQPGWTARIAFQDNSTDGATAPQLLIMVTPADPSADSVMSSSPAQPGESVRQVTVDGCEARIVTQNGFVGLNVYGVNGLTVFVEARGASAIADVGGAAGITAYFRTLTILGADPAHWTSAVVG